MIKQPSEAKMNLAYGFFRKEWPVKSKGFIQIRDGIDEVHAVVTEFIGTYNRIEATGEMTPIGRARAIASPAKRYLVRLKNALDMAKRNAEGKLEGIEADAARSLPEDPTNGRFSDEMRAEIRLMGESAFSFLEERMRAKDVAIYKAIADPVPAWLSGLNDNEKAALVRIFREAIDPTLDETRHQLNVALNELTRAAQAAEALIRSNSDFSAPSSGPNVGVPAGSQFNDPEQKVV